jgi:frataxin
LATPLTRFFHQENAPRYTLQSTLTGKLLYTIRMLDEASFRQHADAALEALKRSLIRAEEEGGFEAEEQSGALNVVFEEPPGKFVITPNTPVRQIWISALSTSFKLEWSGEAEAFVLPKTGETLKEVVQRAINQHLGMDAGDGGAVALP